MATTKFVGTEALQETITKTKTLLNGKVDKVTGKGLSTNDYTTAEQLKLQDIETGAQVNVQSDWNATTGDAFIKNKPTLGTAASKDTGTSAGNVPVLDANGKLDDRVVPALAITNTFEVESQAEMLALNAEEGDVAIRSDESKSYILKQTPASTLANWKELKTPLSPVSSVNGKTGAVSLGASDVGAYTTSETDTLLNAKADSSALSGYVPTSRTINNKQLSSNITLAASDVGAYTTSQVDTALSGKQDTMTPITAAEVDAMF